MKCKIFQIDSNEKTRINTHTHRTTASLRLDKYLILRCAEKNRKDKNKCHKFTDYHLICKRIELFNKINNQITITDLNQMIYISGEWNANALINPSQRWNHIYFYLVKQHIRFENVSSPNLLNAKLLMGLFDKIIRWRMSCKHNIKQFVAQIIKSCILVIACRPYVCKQIIQNYPCRINDSKCR